MFCENSDTNVKSPLGLSDKELHFNKDSGLGVMVVCVSLLLVAMLCSIQLYSFFQYYVLKRECPSPLI